MDGDDLLETFRKEWHKEISNSANKENNNLNSVGQASLTPGAPCPAVFENSFISTSRNNEDGVCTKEEVEAADLFKKGVWHEQHGKLYEAIRFYRRAIAMVPDIEIRVHRQYIEERAENSTNAVSVDSEYDYIEDENEEDAENVNDLVSRFDALLSNNKPICQPIYAQKTAHISCLPVEMLERILLWIVGDHLDLNSLDRMASVCRGFYIICRRPEIWKRACLRIWGINVGDVEPYNSWRNMFLTRPHPRFNGCYISKTTYFRSGENGFQDLSYEPWQIVTYFRYLRFYPNGRVLMLTSSEEPQSIVGYLKKDSKLNQIFEGHYRIHSSSVSLLFRTLNRKSNKGRNRRRDQGTTDVAETTFQMEFEIKDIRGRLHWQLHWKCYNIVSCYFSGSRTVSVVDVSDPNRFSCLNYSRVKSYNLESESPLS